jgi:hypothetical protein
MFLTGGACKEASGWLGGAGTLRKSTIPVVEDIKNVSIWFECRSGGRSLLVIVDPKQSRTSPTIYEVRVLLTIAGMNKDDRTPYT